MKQQNVEDIYGLTAMQEGMLFHSIKADSSSMYAEQFSCKLTGEINEDSFWRAWQKVIDENAILRTAFVWEKVKKPIQVVLNHCKLSYLSIDWRGYSRQQIEKEYEAFKKNDRMIIFDLEKAPLMRFALIRISENTYYFIWSFHHIIMDGWSLPIVINQMVQNYEAIQSGIEPASLKNDRTYKDYIAWLKVQDREQAKKYWENLLCNYNTESHFERVFVGNENQKKVYKFSKEVEVKFNQFLKKRGYTQYQLYNYAYAALLGKYFGKEDIVFGMTVSGRPMQLPGISGTVGMFVNTVPKQVSLSSNTTISETLEQIQKQQIERSNFEYLSLSEIGSAVGNRSLFDSILVIENYADFDNYKQIKEFQITDLQLREEINYPLAWIIKYDEGICVECVYDTAYFTESMIDAFFQLYTKILTDVIENDEKTFAEIASINGQKNIVITQIEDTKGNSEDYQSLLNKKITVTDKNYQPLPIGFNGLVCLQEKDKYIFTGYIGRFLSEEKLYIDDLHSSISAINNKEINFSDVEKSILDKGIVDEIKIIAKVQTNQRKKMIVYYTEMYRSFRQNHDFTDYENWHNFVKQQVKQQICEVLDISLGEIDEFADISPIIAMPHEKDGAIRVEKLHELPVLSENLAIQTATAFAENNHLEKDSISYKYVAKKKEHPKVHISELVDNYSFLKKDNHSNHEISNASKEQINTENQPFLPSYIEGEELIIPDETVYDLGFYIKRAAENAPKDRGIRFIDDEEKTTFRTYRQIYEEALSVCSGLLKKGMKPGDKVIFQMESNHFYIVTFWACMLGGFISVPVSIAASYKEENDVVRKLFNSWKMLEEPVIVTERSFLEDIKKVPVLLNKEGSFNVLATEDLMTNEVTEINYQVKPNNLALMPLTSGSTGMPKAVMQTHKTIILRTIAACQYHHFGEEVTFNWMPMDHVGGIIMSHIRDVYLYCQEILSPVNYILADPIRWLKIMSDYKVTNTWAPNFSFNLINSFEKEIKTMKFDLSALRLITNGGEVVVANTTLKFNELLSPFYFDKAAMKPCFGMSETCSGTIYSEDFGDGVVKKGDSRVNVGKPLPGYSLRIVDENNQVVSENTEGRFQMKGPSIMLGYYNNKEATDEAFSSDGWLDTGDIGMISERGLAITGRAKDIIIINGNNYNNSDIEAMIDSIEGIEVSYTAAVTVKADSSQKEELAIFFNPNSMEPTHIRSAVKEMQKIITAQMNVPIRYIIPLPKKEIPKTGIGKIQRIQLRNSLLNGEYDAILKEMDKILDRELINPWVFKKVWVKDWNQKKQPEITEHRKVLVFADEIGLYKKILKKMNRSCEIIIYDPDTFSSVDHSMITDIIYLENYKSNSLQQIRFINKLKYFDECNLLENVTVYVAATNVFDCLDEKKDCYSNASLVGLLTSFRVEKDSHIVLLDLEGNDIEKDAENLIDELSTNFCVVLKSKEITEMENSSKQAGRIIPVSYRKARYYGHQNETTLASEVCYRKGKRYTWKFEQVELKKEASAVNIKSGGIYVVTGGLGGIGTRICSALLEDYHVQLVILGRSNLESLNSTHERVLNYNLLKEIDSTIKYESVDLCDRRAVKEAISRIEVLKNKKIDGIIHLAGDSSFEEHLSNLEDYQLLNESEEQFAKEYSVKVLGTMNLFETIKENKEAVFIAISSITSTIGSSSFSAYSAGNSFLEGYLNTKSKEGYKTKCLAFTIWNNIGMTKGNPVVNNYISRMNGQHIIGKEEGVRYFKALLNVDVPLLYIGIDENNVNMKSLIKTDTETMDELILTIPKDYLNKLGTFNNQVEDAYGNFIEFKIAMVDEQGEVEQLEQFAEAKTDVERTFEYMWTEILEIDHIGVNDNFFERGGHSLKATQVVSRIKKEYAVDVAINDLFYYPTIRQLSAVIENRLGKPEKKDISFEKYLDTEKREGIQASYAQQRLWFLKQYDSQSAFYNMTETLKLEGKLDYEAMNKAVTMILKRHEGLRTTFLNVDGSVLQRVNEIEAIEIPIVNELNIPLEKRDERLVVHSANEIATTFDLEKGPLVHFKLIKFAEDSHAVLLTMHHIISDGWSMGIFVKEFAYLYEAIVHKKKIELPKIEWQYADFTKWQRNWFKGEVKQKQLDYWKKKLENVPALDIPTDYDRPILQTFEGKKEYFVFSRQVMERVNNLAEQTGATSFMIYLAAINVLFARYTGQEDIAVGTPIANRVKKETELTFGFFVNTLVLRNDLSGNPTFLELIERVKVTALEGYDVQDMPFEMLVDELDVERDLSRNPLFQVMFALQNEEIPEFELPGLEINRVETDNNSAMFDFWISMREFEDGIHTLCEYNTDLYKRETVKQMMKYLETILDSLSSNPELTIQEFPFMEPHEINEMIYELNNTKTVFEDNLLVHQLFEKQAVIQAEQKVLIYDGESITYDELNKQSNRIAHYLIQHRVQPNDFVGVYTYRSIDMFIAIYGVLKAGATYVPIDPTYPADRIRYMVQDSGIKIVLTNSEELDAFDKNIEVIDIRKKECFEMQSVENPNIKTNLEDGVYMTYTSGSTGKPKGVINTHKGLRNRINWIQQVLPLGKEDIQMHKTPYCFDVSCGEIFWAPAVGSKLVIAKPEGHRDVDYMIDLINQEKITHIHFVPSMLKIFLDHPRVDEIRSLKKVFCSGEALTHSLKEEFYHTLDAELYNLYGPTEAAVEVSYFDCKTTCEKKHVPIGKPIMNTQLYVLDSYGHPVPYNVSGELMIAGDNVAKGYHNRFELTEEKFVPNPFSSEAGSRMYRTGDKVRIHRDGNIEYIGRIDNQVKVRGQRVELGEIEKVIQSHPSVKRNIVVVESEQEDLRVLSYIIKNENYQVVNDDSANKEQLKQWESVFDHAYNEEERIKDETVNSLSWNSSYTGEKIAEEEMEEWLLDSVNSIKELKPHKVLEIGCGTGMILFKVAPLCDEYVGVDLSEVGLSYIKEHLNDQTNVRLYQKSADDLGELLNETFDTIIINSVVQYFPDINYFEKVMETLFSILRPKGSIFLGDIRSFALLENYHTSVELFKADDNDKVANLKKEIDQAILSENELLIDTTYFLNYMNENEQVANVVNLQKKSRYENEMSKYRFQTIITTKEAKKLEAVEIYQLNEVSTLEEIKQLVFSSKADMIIIENLKTKRLAFEKAVLALLEDDSNDLLSIRELRKLASDQREEIFDFAQLDQETAFADYKIYPLWSGHGIEGDYSLVFLNMNKLEKDITISDISIPKKSLEQVKNDLFTNPVEWKNTFEYIPKLRDYLKTKLPDYMIPAFFIILEEFPLLPNGKLDRKALPTPKNAKRRVLKDYEVAKNDIEETIGKIWESFLPIEHIGVNDNFFDIGGHSLLLIQVYYKIKEEYETNLTVIDMFKFPTIRLLSEYIESGENQNTLEKATHQAKKSKESMKMNKKRMKDLMGTR